MSKTPNAVLSWTYRERKSGYTASIETNKSVVTRFVRGKPLATILVCFNRRIETPIITCSRISTRICGTISGHGTCAEYYRVERHLGSFVWNYFRPEDTRVEENCELNSRTGSLSPCPGIRVKGFLFIASFSFPPGALGSLCTAIRHRYWKGSFMHLYNVYIHYVQVYYTAVRSPETLANLKRLLSSSTLSRSVYIYIPIESFVRTALSLTVHFESHTTK